MEVSLSLAFESSSLRVHWEEVTLEVDSKKVQSTIVVRDRGRMAME